jgi:hypothetical protein
LGGSSRIVVAVELCVDSAAALLAHLAGDDTAAIWDVSIAPVRT